jgi:hypothetical protein
MYVFGCDKFKETIEGSSKYTVATRPSGNEFPDVSTFPKPT